MRKRRKLIVGLTGSYGSGKTTVGRWFRRWGAEVMDADRVAHEALRTGTPTYRRIAHVFAGAVTARGGRLDRKELARQVFTNRTKRLALERIIHPYVFRRLRTEMRRARRRIVVLEIPLLFETGYDRRVDRTVTVRAGAQTIFRRIRGKRKVLRRDFTRRTKAQMPVRLKARQSDFVIVNNESISKTKKRARYVWAQLKREVT